MYDKRCIAVVERTVSNWIKYDFWNFICTRLLMRIVKAIALGIGLSFLGVAGNASADSLIINGSFEQGSFIGGSFGWPLAQQIIGPDSTTLPGWPVTGGGGAIASRSG